MVSSSVRYGVALFLGALVWSIAIPADEPYSGSDECAACHEEVVTSFRTTSHALAPGWKESRGCESCHGPGAAHIEGSGDVTRIVRLRELTAEASSKVCLECHTRKEQSFTHKSALHGIGDVACADCHDPHSRADGMLRREGVALCAECHQSIASQFELPRSHPLAMRGEGCVSCHDPHGSSSLSQLAGPGTVRCATCHVEKAGPFLYSHDVSLVDGCQSCHRIHGTSNRHLLAHERQINLCYQCHPGTTTPGFHSAPAFLNEKCTACHTAIHGSNTHPAFLEE